MVVLVLAQAGSHASGPVWVDVPAPLRCPQADAVLAALRSRLGGGQASMGKGDMRGISLRLSQHGAHAVTVALRRPGAAVVERTIAASDGECATLAHTVALLAESWLTTPPTSRPTAMTNEGKSVGAVRTVEVEPTTETYEDALPMPSAAGEAAPTSSAPSQPDAHMIDGVKPDAALPKPHAVAPTPPAPSTEAGVVRAQGGLAPTLAPSRPDVIPTVNDTRAVVAPAAKPAWAIGLAAEAGAMAQVSSRTAAAAALRLALLAEYRRWMIGALGGVESAVDLDDSTAEILVRHVPLAVALGRVLASGDRGRVATLVGAGGDVVLANASGYVERRSFRVVAPVMLAEVRGEWRLGRWLSLCATADVALALRREQFSIANLGPVASTSRVRAGLMLGALWHIH